MKETLIDTVIFLTRINTELHCKKQNNNSVNKCLN